MGAYASVFGRDKQYSVYETSLEKLEVKIRRCDKRTSSVAKRRSQMQKWTVVVGVTFTAMALAYIAWLKQHASGITGMEHFRRALLSLLCPTLLFLVRAFVTPIFDYIVDWNKARRSRLDADKKKILQELKDSTRFEVVSKIIDKYDPEARATRRALARQMANSPLTPQQQQQQRAQGRGPGRARGQVAVVQQTPQAPGSAVLQMLQATTRALSPMVDHMAHMMADDPNYSAALRELHQQRTQAIERGIALERQVHDLKQRLSKYEAVDDDPSADEGPLLLGPPPLSDDGAPRAVDGEALALEGMVPSSSSGRASEAQVSDQGRERVAGAADMSLKAPAVEPALELLPQAAGLAGPARRRKGAT